VAAVANAQKGCLFTVLSEPTNIRPEVIGRLFDNGMSALGRKPAFRLVRPDVPVLISGV